NRLRVPQHADAGGDQYGAHLLPCEGGGSPMIETRIAINLTPAQRHGAYQSRAHFFAAAFAAAMTPAPAPAPPPPAIERAEKTPLEGMVIYQGPKHPSLQAGEICDVVCVIDRGRYITEWLKVKDVTGNHFRAPRTWFAPYFSSIKSGQTEVLNAEVA